MLFQGQRAVVEGRARIAVRVATLGNRLQAEVAAGDARLEHAPARSHGQTVLRRQEAVRFGERAATAAALAGNVAAPIASPGTTVDAAVDDDHVGESGMDCRRRVRDQRRADIAGLADLPPPRQIRDAQVGGDFGFGTRVHPPLHQTVNFTRLDARIVQSSRDRLQGEHEFRATAGARIIGLAYAGDGH